MRRARAWVGAVLGLAPLLLPVGADTDRPRPGGLAASDAKGHQADEASCATCHPGALKGLRQSVHARLLTDPATRDRACASCHGDLREHALALAQAVGETPKVAVPKVAQSACVQCHPGTGWETGRGAHPLQRMLSGAQAPASQPSAPDAPLAAVPAARGAFDLDWSLLFAAGYRFVERGGSIERYKTDLNLDEGFRLTELDLEGKGHADAFADLVRVESHDIADPWQRVRAQVKKNDGYDAGAHWQKQAITYRASGDYHRVDQKRQESGYDLEVDLAKELRVFGSFTRASEEGYWLTNRVGVRNVNPQTTISGVQSPRRWDTDLWEAGLAGRIADFDWTVAAEYEDQEQRDQWFYSQPASRNPAFPESEDFTSRSTRRGPGVRGNLHVPLGAFVVDAGARFLAKERRELGEGTQAGYDISEFTTTTDAASSGSARTAMADIAATLEFCDNASLLLETRWLDHEEDYKIDQVDVTTYPSLNTITTTTTNLWQETVQRVWEGSAQLDFQPVKSLDLSVGYGFEREWLKVPDLDASDFDFRSGSISTDGVILGAQWRPDARWTVKTGWRAFGQQGLNLNEIEDDDVREVTGGIGYKRERWSLDATVKNRRSENDVSRTTLDSIVATTTGTLRPGDGFDLHASVTFSDIDARTLTNFYFDPDPAPVPTYVGFRGDTYTVTSGLELRPCARVTWKLDGAWTQTTGDFDIELWDVRADLSARVTRGGSAGIAARWIDYEEQGGADDYDAGILLLYWRQKVGGK